MFNEHKVATAIGAIGAVILMGHVVLGRSTVPVAVALAGVVLVAVAAVVLFVARRR